MTFWPPGNITLTFPSPTTFLKIKGSTGLGRAKVALIPAKSGFGRTDASGRIGCDVVPAKVSGVTAFTGKATVPIMPANADVVVFAGRSTKPNAPLNASGLTGSGRNAETVISSKVGLIRGVGKLALEIIPAKGDG